MSSTTSKKVQSVDAWQGVETILSELTSRSMQVSGSSQDELLRWAVMRSGQVFDLDRVCALLYRIDNNKITASFQWNNPNLNREIDVNSIDLKNMPWTIGQVQQMQVIQIDDIHQLPPEADAEKAFYQQMGFKSLLEFPLKINPDTYGIISFVHIHHKKVWNVMDIRQKRMVADAIGNHLARISALNDLQQTIQRYQTLYNHSPIAIWEEDFSQVKSCLDQIGCQNSQELRTYLQQKPALVFDLVGRIRVVDVNETTVKLWNHSDRNNLIGSLKASMPDENLTCWIEELVAIFENRLYYMIEDQLVASKTGETLHANLYWSVVPGHEKDWAQVLVSSVDITRQIETEQSLHDSEERLRMMLENAEDIVLLQDLNGKYLYYNGLPRYGMTTEDMLGKYPSDLYEPTIAEEIVQSLVTVSQSRKPVSIELCSHWGGETNWFSNLVYPVFNASNEVMAVGTISRNITKRKLTEQALAEAQRNLSSRVAELEKRNQEISLLSEMLTMLQFSSEIDEAYRVIHQFMQQLFTGLPGSILELENDRSELVQRVCWGMAADAAIHNKADDCWALRSGKKHFVSETEQGLMCRHMQAPYPRSSLCVPFIVDSTPTGCLHLETGQEKQSIAESDIRLAQAASEQIGLALTNIRLRIGLRQQAIHDALTGLYNRHYLEETITRELYRQERSGQPLSLIMMDLDHLKQINDMYGHAAGDAVLRELGKLIRRSIRVSDMPCRYGGDEFMLVMPDTQLETAVRRAEYIAENFRRLSIPFGAQTLGGFSLSIGVSCSHQHGHTHQDLMDAADRALYQAKRSGRDRVVEAETHARTETIPHTVA